MRRRTTLVSVVALACAVTGPLVAPRDAGAQQPSAAWPLVRQDAYLTGLSQLMMQMGPEDILPLALMETDRDTINPETLQRLFLLREALTRQFFLSDHGLMRYIDESSDPEAARRRRAEALDGLLVLRGGRDARDIALRAIRAYAVAHDSPQSKSLRIEARALNCAFHTEVRLLLVDQPRLYVQQGGLDAGRYAWWASRVMDIAPSLGTREERFEHLRRVTAWLCSDARSPSR